MEIILFIVLTLILLFGIIICLFFPKKYLKYRDKDFNKRDIELVRVQGVLLLFLELFFIVMFFRSL